MRLNENYYIILHGSVIVVIGDVLRDTMYSYHFSID